MATTMPNAGSESEDIEKNDYEPTIKDEPRSLRPFLFGPVKREHADLALLACCFTTGMVDAASFANWSVFVGMQTGNTVILGLSTAVLPDDPYAWLDTLVSIASFLIGCFLTFRITKYFVPADPYSNRTVIVMLFLAQSFLILLSAGLSMRPDLVPQISGGAPKHSAGSMDVIKRIQSVALLPPLAFQSGIQITCSRLLGLNELPVNVLTSTYCDLMVDPKLCMLNNVKRNRRVAAAILLLAGSIAAAWLIRSAGGLQSVLWLAAVIKFIVAAAIMFFLPAAELVRQLSREAK